LKYGIPEFRLPNELVDTEIEIMRKMGIKFNLGVSFRFDVFCIVNNIFDEKYASQILINASSFGGNEPRYYYPGLPRNYYLGGGIKYVF